jgi:hypothetical protein
MILEFLVRLLETRILDLTNHSQCRNIPYLFLDGEGLGCWSLRGISPLCSSIPSSQEQRVEQMNNNNELGQKADRNGSQN